RFWRPVNLTINVSESRHVSALLDAPANPRACYVLAHGAGAGMTHPFLAAVASGLVARGIACLRYQFPYMEARSRRPDPPALAHADHAFHVPAKSGRKDAQVLDELVDALAGWIAARA